MFVCVITYMSIWLFVDVIISTYDFLSVTKIIWHVIIRRHRMGILIGLECWRLVSWSVCCHDLPLCFSIAYAPCDHLSDNWCPQKCSDSSFSPLTQSKSFECSCTSGFRDVGSSSNKKDGTNCRPEDGMLLQQLQTYYTWMLRSALSCIAHSRRGIHHRSAQVRSVLREIMQFYQPLTFYMRQGRVAPGYSHLQPSEAVTQCLLTDAHLPTTEGARLEGRLFGNWTQMHWSNTL
jgi:hypothetical protein